MQISLKYITPFALIVLQACSQANKEFDEILTKFDEMVGVYEKYSKKSPLCIQDIADINGQVLLKLNDLGAKANKIKTEGPQPSKEQLDNYVKITTRMSQAMIALGANMKTAVMCDNFTSSFSKTSDSQVPATAQPSPPAEAPAPAPAPAPSAAAEIPKPSFDCAKASSSNEKLVCSSVNFSKLDSQLADLYKKARANASNESKLKSEQLDWIKASRKCELYHK